MQKMLNCHIKCMNAVQQTFRRLEQWEI